MRRRYRAVKRKARNRKSLILFRNEVKKENEKRKEKKMKVIKLVLMSHIEEKKMAGICATSFHDIYDIIVENLCGVYTNTSLVVNVEELNFKDITFSMANNKNVVIHQVDNGDEIIGLIESFLESEEEKLILAFERKSETVDTYVKNRAGATRLKKVPICHGYTRS